MSKLRVTDVFTPNSFPERTYVRRDDEDLEGRFRTYVGTPGQLISVSGPSKSGKTVLVEYVVGRDNLIAVSGAGVRAPAEIWDRVLDWMGVPTETTDSNSQGVKGGVTGEVAAEGSIIFAKGGAKAGGSAEGSLDWSKQEKRARRGLAQVVKEIANSDFVVLIDDFHYMDRDVQLEVAKQLKEAIRLGIRICTAAVPHRSDDVVRALPELRGRVATLDLGYWSKARLRTIAETGFGLLNVTLPTAMLDRLATEAAGSPQLMQSLCLHACFVLGIAETSDSPRSVPVDEQTLSEILKRTATTTDFRSLVEILGAGPKTRGTERKTFEYNGGGEGDVYRTILRAIADDPPMLSFSYEELTARVARICVSDSPIGGSVVGSCSQMARLAVQKAPMERAIDWDEQRQVLEISDPLLAFYLRWGGQVR